MIGSSQLDARVRSVGLTKTLAWPQVARDYLVIIGQGQLVKSDVHVVVLLTRSRWKREREMEKLQNPLKCNLTKLRVNRTLHGRSKYRPADVGGHNVVTGWYIKMDRDAVDWFILAGTPVYASHSGTISSIRDPNGVLGCVIITGTGSDRIYRSVSAHLHVHESLKVGQSVEKGKLIGWVGRVCKDPHLHYELWKNGQGICAPTAQKLSEKLATFFGN